MKCRGTTKVFPTLERAVSTDPPELGPCRASSPLESQQSASTSELTVLASGPHSTHHDGVSQPPRDPESQATVSSDGHGEPGKRRGGCRGGLAAAPAGALAAAVRGCHGDGACSPSAGPERVQSHRARALSCPRDPPAFPEEGVLSRPSGEAGLPRAPTRLWGAWGPHKPHNFLL